MYNVGLDRKADSQIEKAAVRTNLSFCPEVSRVCLGSAFFVGQIHLCKQALVPFQVDMPMLHGMRDVGCLNQMLDNDCRFSVRGDLCRLWNQRLIRNLALLEGSCPLCVALDLEVLGSNVCGQSKGC